MSQTIGIVAVFVAAADLVDPLREQVALDEYGGLAPDDPGRCRNMLQRYLLDRIDLPHDRFHFINTETSDLDRVCRWVRSGADDRCNSLT